MKDLKLIIYVLLLGCISVSASGQTNYPVVYTLPDTLKVTAGTELTVPVVFSVNEPWYIYAPTGNNAAQGMMETNVILNLPKGFTRKGKIQLPESKFKGSFEVYEGKHITFNQKLAVDKDAVPGEYLIKGKIRYQTCNEKICLPPKTDDVEIKVMVRAASPGVKQGNDGKMLLNFTAIDGRKVDLAKLKGKLVLVDCWATWCRPCIAEFDHLKKLYDKYHKQGFEVIGVSADVLTAKPRVLKLVKEHALPWPQRFEGVGFDKDAFLQANGVQALPTVFLIDTAGNVVDRDARGEKLEGLIKKYLK